ncbi:MAG: hypothetical protein EOM20_00765 [Spartobacteria bacterium]|nr:hypothetical protein [Spartobacteria bacterium]
MKVLMTGMMGVGKSTVCRAVLAQGRPRALCGFRSRRCRPDDPRGGFELVTWRDEAAVFAFPDPDRGPRYRIDREVFNTLGVASLQSPAPDAWCVIDELGIMEQEASFFVTAVRQAWAHSATALFVVQQRALPFWREVLEIDEAAHGVLTVTGDNRDHMAQTALDALLA